jgi:hypothetical protein
VLAELLPAGSADIIRSGGERSIALRVPAYLFALLIVFAVACGNGGEEPASRQGPPEPGDAQAIRSFDLEAEDVLQDLVAQLGGGAIDSGAILYADLTGDLREEAVVPVSSQGTLGNIGYVIFTLDGGEPTPVLTRTVDRSSASGLQMSVDDGVLMETRGVFGPEDPFCCPSQLRQTTFRWDGSQLQVENEELVQQDPGPKR